MNEQRNFDVVIIGAGAVGNAIARTLTGYKLSVAVVEKEPDTAFGISGRNSGVVHAGFNNRPGSLMAKLCVQGSEHFGKAAEELGIPFNKTGKLVIALSEEDIPGLYELKDQGEANGTRELRLVDSLEIKKINPNINGVMGLWSGMTGVFDPFAFTIALAENAKANGAVYFFDHQVTSIISEPNLLPDNHGFRIQTSGNSGMPVSKDFESNDIKPLGTNKELTARWVINSGGLHSDEICRMVGIEDYVIYPCRGEYHILDQKISAYLSLPVYPVPGKNSGGLGVHLTSAPSGNIIIGPSSEYIGEKEDYRDTKQVMDELFAEGSQLLPGIASSHIIKSFAGVRPKLTGPNQGGFADFVISESTKVPGFIILTGIESPGITSAIPISEKVAGILLAREHLEKNENHNPKRHEGRSLFSQEEKNRSKSGQNIICQTGQNINSNMAQNIICRCEGITEAEVLFAYDRILEIGAIPTMKGIKNRTRAGMGRCQGGFCAIKIAALLQEKRGVDPLHLHFNTLKDTMFVGRTRE